MITSRATLGPEYGYSHWSWPGAIVDAVPVPYWRPVSDDTWAPVSNEHALISPPAAAAGADDAAAAEVEADGEVALADAAADVAGLADEEVSALGESA
jgi:hypothetical protein